MPLSNVTDGRPLQVLTLGLDGEVFALETDVVREVLDVVTLTAVPGSRKAVKGLINVRGKVVPVIDLKTKFHMGETVVRTADARIVVIEALLRGEPTMVGLLADRVHEVTELAAASLEDAPRIGMTWRPEFIRAIGKRGDDFVIVIDIARVIAAPDGAAAGREAA